MSLVGRPPHEEDLLGMDCNGWMPGRGLRSNEAKGAMPLPMGGTRSELPMLKPATPPTLPFFLFFSSLPSNSVTSCLALLRCWSFFSFMRISFFFFSSSYSVL